LTDGSIMIESAQTCDILFLNFVGKMT